LTQSGPRQGTERAAALDRKSVHAGPHTEPEIPLPAPRDGFEISRVSRPSEVSQVSNVRVARDVFSTRPSRPNKTHTRGAMGPSVRRLQRTLVRLGHLTRDAFATGPGVFGPRTEQAVRAFQLQAGLSPSGQVDALTELALQQSGRA
jgi:hypothetical protein